MLFPISLLQIHIFFFSMFLQWRNGSLGGCSFFALRRHFAYMAHEMRIIQSIFCRLPEGNAYDVLLSVFGKLGTPLFKAFLDYGRGERDGDKLALSVEKHLSEVFFECFSEVFLLKLRSTVSFELYFVV